MNYVGRTCDHGIIYTCATLYKQQSGCFDAKNDVLCPRCKKSIVEGDWKKRHFDDLQDPIRAATGYGQPKFIDLPN